MMYSSGIFKTENDSLEKASMCKLDTICDYFNQAADSKFSVLEIGSGWGGFVKHFAASFKNANITSTTISDKQFDYIKKNILYNQNQNITFLKKDYRDLTGSFDHIVSIEMIEAVGYQYFNAYFQKIDSLLKQGGKLVLQAILINDNDFRSSKAKVDFIKKYIFPGGCLPSLKIIKNIVQKKTNLRLIKQLDITDSYEKTLMHWHTNFLNKKEIILSMGFSEEFFKIWEFYFCYCAIGFKTKHIYCMHLVFEKI